MIIQKIYKEIIITPTRIAHNEGSQGLIIDTKKRNKFISLASLLIINHLADKIF